MKTYIILLLLCSFAQIAYSAQGLTCHTTPNAQPETKEHITTKENNTPQDCDGGTSKCGTCQTQYENPLMPCNTLFDEHVMQGLHSSKDVMICYERVFAILSQVAPYTASKPIISCPSKIRAAVANHTRMHEEELQKNTYYRSREGLK